MKRFLLFFVSALLFVACDNKFEDEGNTIQGVSNLPTLTAEFADEDTRTYVEDNLYLRWHEGDLISAFVGNTRNSKYIFDGKTHIVDFERVVKCDEDIFADVQGRAETLAGLMLEIRRDLLKKGDMVEAHDIRFTVQSMDGRRVDKIKVVVGQADE